MPNRNTSRPPAACFKPCAAKEHFGDSISGPRRWAVRYYATASGPKVRDAMTAGTLGQIATPAAGNRVQMGVEWVGDNAVFAGKYPGDAEYLAWLADRAHLAADCRFVVAPDVVADAEATLALSSPMLPRIRALGFPVALVAQDGLEDLNVPWDAFDCLFIGGSTEWKLGPDAQALAAEAKRRGKWVHMGRCNSRQRLQYAAAIGCDSVDGTYLAFGPDRNLPTLLSWLRELEWPTLFDRPEGAA